MNKSLLLALISLLPAASLSLAGTGPGPWSSGAYYQGYLNGKYFGVVSGNNISGVLGFAISDGAPPFRTDTVRRAIVAGTTVTIEENQAIIPDVTQNYFAIFVEGRTYSGTTTAGLDIASKKVAGALVGTDPPGIQAFGTLPIPPAAPPVPADGAATALPIVNRGLSGGFDGKITSDKDPITFKADGELSTPANRQTVNITGIPAVYDPLDLPPSPAGSITNLVSTGTVSTETTPFEVRGVRTSYGARNPQADADAAAAAAATGTGGGN